MTVEEFCAAYPRLYHMAEAAAWPGIQRHGLLSTSALLDLYEVPEPERSRIERTRRADFIAVTHPERGELLIRDQKPMTDESLTRALIGMTPSEWYALLNERVFFWIGEERLEKLLNAYRHRDNLVLVLDTATVMARYAAQTTLSPINSGFSARYPQPRGRDTFRPIAEYPFAEWAKKRGGLSKAVAECAVSGGVANVTEALVETRPVPRRTPSAKS